MSVWPYTAYTHPELPWLQPQPKPKHTLNVSLSPSLSTHICRLYPILPQKNWMVFVDKTFKLVNLAFERFKCVHASPTVSG